MFNSRIFRKSALTVATSASLFSLLAMPETCAVDVVPRKASKCYYPPRKSPDSNINIQQWTTLHDAAYDNDYKKVANKCADTHTKIDIKDYYGQTPLWWASSKGSLETAELLIKYGANVNEADYQGVTPILASSELKMIKLLIKNGADTHAVDIYGNTLAHALAYTYSNENDAKQKGRSIEYLINNGHIGHKEMEIKNKNNLTPYDVASDGTFYETLEAFKKGGFEPIVSTETMSDR